MDEQIKTQGVVIGAMGYVQGFDAYNVALRRIGYSRVAGTMAYISTLSFLSTFVGMAGIGIGGMIGDWFDDDDEKEMRELTPDNVAPLYKTKYWDKIKGDDLPAGVDYCVFDAAINSGAGRAAKWLQECVGTQPDGAIGPMTLQAARAMVGADLVNLYCDKRLAFLKALKTWETFGRGWERRVEEVRSAALKML